MSTLTRVDSNSGKKPVYKDYVAFLDNYRSGKKDEISSVTTDSGVSFSLTNSSNNSSTSVASDLNGFHEDLDKFTTQKFNAIRTNFSKDANSEEPRKTLKSEIVIEIKDPEPPAFQQINKVFQIDNGLHNSQNTKNGAHQPRSNNVSEVSKKFENGYENQPRNILSGCHIPKDTVGKKNSIGEISKKFEQNLIEDNKNIPKKSNSINEVSKIFQKNNTLIGSIHNTETKPKVFNNTPKPFTLNNGVTNSISKQVGPAPALYSPRPSCASPKPLITSPKPTLLPPRPSFEEVLSTEPPKDSQTIVSSPIEPPNTNHNVPKAPTPPPLPPQVNVGVSPPPPPPLPIFQQSPTKLLHNNSMNIQNNGVNNKTNGVKVTIQSNRQPQQGDVMDGKTMAELKNDPRVKKAVYGALRGMYGSYHDKANDYIATIPKNRVRKNNGLDSIINSIASQGGLDKLNGRANPDPEVA